ncbi:HAMP domain-containing histidine kinase [Corallincola luteus]|uniref:histidine kinase n=3 Tax=Psychromonadaceae TaxID=267894 RepID=A0ABY1WNY9_9GAMM|nr:HAMP domain-containing histidine kinase [Corallincola spongiicola]TCI03898.1 HAMP domain-containing histidine kinase [Corallincola luteus]
MDPYRVGRGIQICRRTFMLKSLSGQFALYAAGLFLLVGIGVGSWTLASYQTYGEEVEQRLHRGLAAHMVYDNKQLKQGTIDASILKDAFHTMMLLGPDWEIYALDTTGRLLAYSAPPGKVLRQRISLQPIHSFFAGADFPLYGDDPRSATSQRIFSAAPIENAEGELTGYLYVIIGGEQWQTLADMLATSRVLQDSWRLMGAALLFGLVLLVLLFVLLTRPLTKLVRRFEHFTQHDFSRRNEPEVRHHRWTPAEVVSLNQGFDVMAGHIEHQLEQIKTTEQLRRELISHVSHDFRTPLASLQGYLETWLLQSAEQRQPQLIEVALKNARQLNLLVEQLFELVRLEGGDIRFNPEPVVVAELAYDVVQRLQLMAEARGVRLRVETDIHQQQALADIGKLERILVNLIDNALRHTPAGGEVIIKIAAANDAIYVAVADNGCGINEAEVPLIFDPHYRASNSVNGEGANTGLGLAIVQQLVALHGSEIAVQSSQQQGSTFGFSLPLAS